MAAQKSTSGTSRRTRNFSFIVGHQWHPGLPHGSTGRGSKVSDIFHSPRGECSLCFLPCLWPPQYTARVRNQCTTPHVVGHSPEDETASELMERLKNVTVAEVNNILDLHCHPNSTARVADITFNDEAFNAIFTTTGTFSLHLPVLFGNQCHCQPASPDAGLIHYIQSLCYAHY